MEDLDVFHDHCIVEYFCEAIVNSVVRAETQGKQKAYNKNDL